VADNTIILKSSSVAGKVPLTADLLEAEPALNTADKKLYSKDAQGNVFEVGVPMSHVGSGGATHAAATTGQNGFMSSTDKAKLDSVETGANLYALPIATASSLGGVKQGTGVTIDGGGVISATPVNSSTVTSALGFTPADSAATYTKTETDSRIQAIVDVAPAALDTLSELAAAIGDDANFAGTMTTALAGKQATITGGATTIVTNNLTASMALVSDGSGKVAAHSTVSTTELGYLDGVTSAIQTQLNAKAPLASPTLTGTPAVPTATAGTNTTQIASTAFVKTAIDNAVAVLNGGTF
jgi:hypothetical protein